MEKIMMLKGLDCPNCAAKIEKEVLGLAGVAGAKVNLMTETLSLTLDGSHAGDLESAVQKIVAAHEPDIIVSLKGSAPQAQASSKKELIRLLVGAAIYVVGIAVGALLQWNAYVELGILIAAYLVLGGEVLLRAAKNIAKGQVFDENFLMCIATIGAFLIGEYPEAVAVMLFYQVGEMFQNLAVRRSKKSIADLMDIRPDAATVKREGGFVSVGPETVAVGETILVKPGEKIPLDGVILDGESMLDARALTGESVPRSVRPGDVALSGCINQSGVLTMKVTKTFGESTVSKIIDMVENASANKAPTENFITVFSRYYTPVVVGLATLLAVIPPILGFGGWAEWLHRGLVFLVISCPCALVISIPLGFFGGIGGASRRGVLVKGGNYLEALNALDIIVFDKTGTLTKGVFQVAEIAPANGFLEAEVLEYAASAEVFSNHPIAVSIREAFGKAVDERCLSDYTEIAGRGVRVNVNGRTVLAGSEALMAASQVDYLPNGGTGTKVYVAVDDCYAGCVLIADELKRDAKAAIAGLKKLGIRKTVMLTGDNRQIGEEVAAELGLDEVYTELLPGDKVDQLELLDRQKRRKGKLAFVGDGINDAPVLARADVGIAMGGLGSDAAIEAADVVLMTDEPAKLIDAMAIAKFTKRIVVQNIVFALAVKGAILLLGAFGIAGMWEAVFGDVGVALIAILNAMRVMRK
ncbi:MAG: cadmium-translocating P-type ATPase [Oscillospiraceae bacterium]|jgi:Cd2+/Zn2+-exporting ATPase|nr:cadmium-translocating P-type ATPase [Oscillospiraceae bacterium]